jgi:Restriction endonuclease
MSTIDQQEIQLYLDRGAQAGTTTDQGRALEDLVCYLFGRVPGVAITHRNKMNVFATEEVDVALWNDLDPAGLAFLPNIILVECKNWSKAVSSIEVNWFDAKLRNRGLDFGILVAANGITGDAQDLAAAHAVVAAALRDRRRLVVLTTDEILSLGHSDQLTYLIKEKLCDLAVRGTLC